MIVRVKNDKKYVMAEVNNIEFINGIPVPSDKKVIIGAGDILNGTKTVAAEISDLKGGLNDTLTAANAYTDDEVSKLELVHTDSDEIQLMLDDTPLGDAVSLALPRSNVQNIGLYEFNGSWQGITGPSNPTENGTYLVVTYKQDNGNLTYTFANVSHLIDTDTQYTGGNGIDIEDNVVSIDIDERMAGLEQYSTYELSVDQHGLKYKVRDFPRLDDFESAANLGDGMYFIMEDAEEL